MCRGVYLTLEQGGSKMFEIKFIQGIHGKNKLKLSYFSKKDGMVITRVCAPMDYGPSGEAHDGSDRYHL